MVTGRRLGIAYVEFESSRDAEDAMRGRDGYEYERKTLRVEFAKERGEDRRRDYDRGGYDRRGYDRGGYDRRDYDRGGYDRRDYDRGGYDRGGYDRYGPPTRGNDRGQDRDRARGPRGPRVRCVAFGSDWVLFRAVVGGPLGPRDSPSVLCGSVLGRIVSRFVYCVLADSRWTVSPSRRRGRRSRTLSSPRAPPNTATWSAPTAPSLASSSTPTAKTPSTASKNSTTPR